MLRFDSRALSRIRAAGIFLLLIAVGSVAYYVGTGAQTFTGTSTTTSDNKISSLESEILKLNSTVMNLEAQISSLKISLERAEKELEVSQNRLAEEQGKVANLTAQVSTLKRRISDLEAFESRLERVLRMNMTLHYDWAYNSRLWAQRFQLDLTIPLSTYVDYRNRPRPSTDKLVNLAKDPDDGPYIEDLVNQLNNTAATKGFSGHGKINFILAFVQSFPYGLDNETDPMKDYPRYPIETLFDHRGDCADTSILLAALLDRMGYNVALLLLTNEKHMAVGIEIEEPYSFDYSATYYTVGGKKYFYLETTGEGWRIGQVPSEIKDIQASIYPLST